MTENLLPEPFRTLTRYSDWALATERERSAKERASTIEEVRAFYDAVAPQLEAIIAYLDRTPFSNMPPENQRLLNMALALIETADLIELYKRREKINMVPAERFVPYE